MSTLKASAGLFCKPFNRIVVRQSNSTAPRERLPWQYSALTLHCVRMLAHFVGEALLLVLPVIAAARSAANTSPT